MESLMTNRTQGNEVYIALIASSDVRSVVNMKGLPAGWFRVAELASSTGRRDFPFAAIKPLRGPQVFGVRHGPQLLEPFLCRLPRVNVECRRQPFLGQVGNPCRRSC